VILAAAVCPHPPLLVPDIAPGTADELAELRSACDAAVRTLLGARPECVVIIGAGNLFSDADESAGGTLAGFGVDVNVGGPLRTLPLSLTIGAWLLDRAGWTGPRIYSTQSPEIVGDVAVLVMADGTTTRSIQAPGFLDERAESYDAAIAQALANGDAEALAALDSDRGAQLGASGIAALQMLGVIAKGAEVTAQLRYDEAPFGVGYFVADWVF
jgi:hypothetical protein